MVSDDLIDTATANWAGPTAFVTKKYGSLQFCVNSRKLNAVTVQDVYPLPEMDERIDLLGDARIFSMLDAYNGYW